MLTQTKENLPAQLTVDPPLKAGAQGWASSHLSASQGPRKPRIAHFHPPCLGLQARPSRLIRALLQEAWLGGSQQSPVLLSSRPLVSLAGGLPPGLGLRQLAVGWACGCPSPLPRPDTGETFRNASGTDSFAQRQHPTRHLPPGRRWDTAAQPPWLNSLLRGLFLAVYPRAGRAAGSAVCLRDGSGMLPAGRSPSCPSRKLTWTAGGWQEQGRRGGGAPTPRRTEQELEAQDGRLGGRSARACCTRRGLSSGPESWGLGR